MQQHDFKKYFSLFDAHPELIYLDTAATALVPRSVIAAMNAYYETYSGNIHRGLYDLSAQATQAYEASRQDVARFINAKKDEIIFTSGTTASINMLAEMLASQVKKGDAIVLTRFEHHANLLPWQKLAHNTGCELRFIEMTDDYCVDLDSAKKIIDEQVKIVAFSLMSNTLGTITPAKELIALAKTVGAITVCDAAQAVAHMPIDVQDLDCDFLAFSGHKLYGPTGVGVLSGKRDWLQKLEPVVLGGDMVREVGYENATWADAPEKFEAGTPPIAEVIGLAAAIRFIESIGWDVLMEYEKELVQYAIEKLQAIPELKIIGPQNALNRCGVFSFVVDGVHPHDMAQILSDHHVAVRAGHHCTMPLMRHLGLIGTTRASFGMNTAPSDIDALVEAIKAAQGIFGSKQ